MRPQHLRELFEKKLLTDEQFTQLDSIYSKRLFSVFYELRTLMYLGVMLFTTGMGILIYKNIGELGHMLAIAALFILTAVCFSYAFRKTNPYSNDQVETPVPYFDYIVLLGCLLFISVLGYLQFQFSLFDDGMGLTTLITAIFFFYAAYRFDHVGVLSLAITALASFWSISVTPQKWYSGDFFTLENLQHVAVIFGLVLAGAAVVLDKKKIKQHFTFTYVNMASLIFFGGALAGIFDGEGYAIYLLLLAVGCALAVYFANWKKSFLFLLYAFVCGYIGFTHLLSNVDMDEVFWFFYMIASCGGLVMFIIRYRNFFKRADE